MARTVLRVKRRRDDPTPPSTFKLQPESRKRRRGDDDDEETKELTDMLSSSHLLHKRKHETLPLQTETQNQEQPQDKVQPILFRRVEPVTHKRKSHPDDHVQVVDATLDFEQQIAQKLPQSIESHSWKRPRISLQMIDAKIMPEEEFWRQHSSTTEHTELSQKEKMDESSQALSNKKDLRARMRRTVSKMSTASSTSHTSKGKKILDPISRQIQDGLTTIHSVPSTNVTEAIVNHVQLLLKYPQKVNTLCNNGSGTILHACALYNSVDGTKYLLDNFRNQIDFQKRDSDFHTALQIAHSVGSRGVVDVIQSYYSGDDGDDERDEDFIYDVYCVDDHHGKKDHKIHHSHGHGHGHGNHVPRMPQGSLDSHPPGELLSTESLPQPAQSPIPPLTTPQNSMNLDPSYPPSTASHLSEDGSIPPVVSLKGGFGYWNQDGELVIDIHPDADMADSDLEDDEYDSNREDCDANEYPDDDLDDLNNSDHEVGHHFHANIERGTGMTPPRFSNNGQHYEDDRMHQYEDSEEEDDYYYDQTAYVDFRNRPVDLGTLKVSGTSNGFVSSLHDENDDGEEEEGEYSGIMYGADSGRWSNERIYCETEVFDPIMDGDDSD